MSLLTPSQLRRVAALIEVIEDGQSNEGITLAEVEMEVFVHTEEDSVLVTLAFDEDGQGAIRA